MTMFCFQCQETLRNQACAQHGMCGKTSDCSNLMDALIYALRGLAAAVETAEIHVPEAVSRHIQHALFVTLTNTNFDELTLESLIRETLRRRDELMQEFPEKFEDVSADVLLWTGSTRDDFLRKSASVGVLSEKNPDLRSMREFLLYGLKGISAYTTHALRLGFENERISAFIVHALAFTADREKLSVTSLLKLLNECGKMSLAAMKLLNEANTQHFGNPEATLVRNTVGNRPGILVSGHDLLDLEELLIQARGTGIDVYTHGEMLPANAYPELKKFEDLYGNYGNAWYSQNNEFERFNGPILMTSNCIIPPRASYRTRLFTTGAAGWPGVRHIPTPTDGTMKDFTEIIRMAKTCVPPEPLIESANGTPEPEFLEIGFGISQLKACAEEIAAGIKSGEIGRIVVMGGCDGRQVERKYYTELARQFPENVLILTAGCAKYRFNKLETGSLGSLPRVLDAGQCNDTWSIACFMVELCEMLNAETVNQLPVTFELAWYEQKSVSVLLGLLALGVRNINLGPTLPAFCSPNIIKYMNENYGLQKIRTVQEELKEICMQTTCMA